MGKGTRSEDPVVQFHRDIQQRLRLRIREAIEVVLEEELDEALGCGAYERSSGRRGYRNGSPAREITTGVGLQRIRVPRGRLFGEEGSTREFHSAMLPRYARRTREVDEAILGSYLAGANSRRIRKALEPLLGQDHLSKSAVSRIVGRLKDLFAAWNERDLSEESYPIVYLDGFNLKVRLARRVVSVPVLAVLGVAENGRKQLVALRFVRQRGRGPLAGVGRGPQAPGVEGAAAGDQRRPQGLGQGARVVAGGASAALHRAQVDQPDEALSAPRPRRAEAGLRRDRVR